MPAINDVSRQVNRAVAPASSASQVISAVRGAAAGFNVIVSQDKARKRQPADYFDECEEILRDFTSLQARLGQWAYKRKEQ